MENCDRRNEERERKVVTERKKGELRTGVHP
jgi:hypothetical protein